MPKERVDVLAYKQGLFDTREQAKRGVMAGLVVNVINGERYDKPGEKIDDATELKLKGEKLKYVSRGGLKLEKGLKVFNLSVEGMTTIDIGASTGGFTDVMLQNGAKLVYAVDVGTNQLVSTDINSINQFSPILKHNISKTTCRSTNINRSHAFNREIENLQAFFKFKTSTTDILKFFPFKLQLCRIINFFTRFVITLTIDNIHNQTSHHATFSLFSCVKKALFIGQDIYSFLRHGVVTFL